MSKSDLITTIAGLPDTDERLSRIGAILNGKAEGARPASLRLLRICEAVNVSGLSRTTIYAGGWDIEPRDDPSRSGPTNPGR